MKYLFILLTLLSFTSQGQTRYTGRAWNVAIIDTSLGAPNTRLYWADMDSLRSAIDVVRYTTTSATRSFNSNFQPSTTRTSLVRYCVSISCALTLSGGQTGSVFLEYSADGSTGWTEAGRMTNTNAGAVIIGVAVTNTQTGQVNGIIPMGYYVRLRSTGAATITYISGQETLL